MTEKNLGGRDYPHPKHGSDVFVSNFLNSIDIYSRMGYSTEDLLAAISQSAVSLIQRTFEAGVMEGMYLSERIIADEASARLRIALTQTGTPPNPVLFIDDEVKA